MTIEELTELYGMELLVEVSASLGIELKDRYEDDSAELTALIEQADELRTSTTSKRTKTKAPGRKSGSGQPCGSSGSGNAQSSREGKLTTAQLRQRQQQKTQGAMVEAQQKMSRSAISAAQQQGRTDSDNYLHSYANSFMSNVAGGLHDFAAMIGGLHEPLTHIADAVVLDAELESLKGELYDQFLGSSQATAETLWTDFGSRFTALGTDLTVDEIQAWIDEEQWEADREANQRPLAGILSGFQI